MDGFPSGQRGQTVNLLAMPSKVRILPHPFIIAGWSSLEARRAHNPKVTGSNPVPATNYILFYAQLAPLVEQRTENPRVSGSIPELGTKKTCKANALHVFFTLIVKRFTYFLNATIALEKRGCLEYSIYNCT